MRAKNVLTIVLAILLVLGAGNRAIAAVDGSDRVTSVTAAATIDPDTALNITPNAITFYDTAGDSYPNASAGGAVVKIKIDYTSNYSPWKIAVYTNNTQVPNYTPASGTEPAKGKYAKGGLATANGSSVVACKWVAKKDGNSPPAASAINNGGKDNTGFNYIKDLRDEDDPATGTPQVPQNESWAAGFAVGYANIAYGDSGSGVCVDPTVYFAENDPRNFRGNALAPGDDIAVYVAGLFGTGGNKVAPSPASAGTYASNIFFDLYHE